MKLTSPEIYMNIDDIHTLVRQPPQSVGVLKLGGFIGKF